MRNLSVVVVGAGIGGLATALALATSGHQVEILDAVEEFTEVGAGIRVPPNSSRLLLEWGVDLAGAKKEIAQGIRFADWKDNVLLDVSYALFKQTLGMPYYLMHRADLIDALLAAVRQHPNITLRTGTKVVGYDFAKPAVRTALGIWHHGDLVVSVEGIKSSIRTAVNGEPVELRDTGDTAYRILVPAAHLLQDPEMSHLVTNVWATHWLGPEGHAVGYPLRGGELYNVIIDITHKTDQGEALGENEWKKQADNSELISRFKDWCPTVQRLCSLTGEYLKWKLVDFPKPLKRWVHPMGKVALLGDACHPMMPYLAQGAAQAIEDAGALQAALAAHDSIPEALSVYEKCRKPRAEYIVTNTRILQEWLHVEDGPVRDSRDEMMKHDAATNPIFWGYSERMNWLFAHNPQNISRDNELHIPEPPPIPPAEASVYLDGIAKLAAGA